MHVPATLDDLNALIANQVTEDSHLDYKRSAALEKTPDKVKTDLAKDVSAFANSDGGVIVFGIVEENRLPKNVDAGVDHARWTRERIESVVNANISPRIDGIAIHQIRLATDRSAYVVAIPKSFRGPHQELVNHRYYKRFNFSSVPMEDYEIQDVRNRRDVVLPLVNIDADIRHGVLMHLVVTNIGDITAQDVRFVFQPALPELIGKEEPTILTKGIRFFAPGKTHRFFFGSAIERLTKQSAPRFDVEVSYYDRRADKRVSDQFHIDMFDYMMTAIVESDVTEQGEHLKKAIEDLTKEVAKIDSKLETISTIAGATGLDLSVSTLRNLNHLKDAEPKIERIPASGLGWPAFAEVLGVDRQTALRFYTLANWTHGQSIDELEGVDPDVIKRAKAAFIFE
jgi:Putative DNA-binding domain